MRASITAKLGVFGASGLGGEPRADSKAMISGFLFSGGNVSKSCRITSEVLRGPELGAAEVDGMVTCTFRLVFNCTALDPDAGFITTLVTVEVGLLAGIGIGRLDVLERKTSRSGTL